MRPIDLGPKRKEKEKQPQKSQRGQRKRENEVQGLPRKQNTSRTLDLLTNAQKKRKLDDLVRSEKREKAIITEETTKAKDESLPILLKNKKALE